MFRAFKHRFFAQLTSWLRTTNSRVKAFWNEGQKRSNQSNYYWIIEADMAVLSKQIVILAKNLPFLILDVIFTFNLSVSYLQLLICGCSQLGY